MQSTRFSCENARKSLTFSRCKCKLGVWTQSAELQARRIPAPSGSILTASVALQAWGDLHLLFDKGTPYPVNSLRMVGVKNSLTNYVLVSDIDLEPNQSMRQATTPHSLRPPRVVRSRAATVCSSGECGLIIAHVSIYGNNH